MNVTWNGSIYGSAASAGYLTFVIPQPKLNAAANKGVRQAGNGGITVTYSFTEVDGFMITASAFQKPLIFLIEGINTD